MSLKALFTVADVGGRSGKEAKENRRMKATSWDVQKDLFKDEIILEAFKGK